MLDFAVRVRILCHMTVCGNHTAPKRETIGAISTELLPRAAYDVAYTPDRTVAGFAFDIQTGSHAFASDRERPFLTRPGSLALTPAGCDIRSRSGTGGEYLTISVTPGRERDIIGDRAAHIPNQYSNGLRAGAAPLAVALRRALMARHRDAGEIESFSALLYAAAWQARVPASKPATSMTPRRLRLVNDLVEARYGETLTVAEMAKVAGLSTSFFIRAFAAATGTTPHAYIMERRLERARCALVHSREPIAGIAHGCGFANQAHLTAAFSRQFGLSPKRFRETVLQDMPRGRSCS